MVSLTSFDFIGGAVGSILVVICFIKRKCCKKLPFGQRHVLSSFRLGYLLVSGFCLVAYGFFKEIPLNVKISELTLPISVGGVALISFAVRNYLDTLKKH